MTTFRLLRSPWITFSVGATVTQASFKVSRFNLCRMAIMQLSPLNLLRNFSAFLLARDDLRALGLTESFPSHLLRCNSKHGECFNHYRHHHSCHRRGLQRFLGINTEVCEEIRDAFKEVEERIITCAAVNSRLTWIDVIK